MTHHYLIKGGIFERELDVFDAVAYGQIATAQRPTLRLQHALRQFIEARSGDRLEQLRLTFKMGVGRHVRDADRGGDGPQRQSARTLLAQDLSRRLQ